MSKRNGTEVIPIQKEHICAMCNSRLATHVQLYIHTRMHNPEKPHFCEVCISRFTNDITLNRITPYLCSICNVYFVDMNYFKKHIDSHTHLAEGPFGCEICNKYEENNGVSSWKNLKRSRHTLGTRETSPPAIDASAFCQIMMRSSTNLPHHVIDKFEKTILCECCEKTFYTMTALKVHKRIHTGEKPYHCKICRKRFTTNSQLKIHSTWHTGLKPVCKVCSQGFTTNSHLREHMRVHTGERPYTCNVCEQSFTQCGSLRRHFKRKHIDVGFICQLCHEEFNSKSSLKMHVMVMHRRK